MKAADPRSTKLRFKTQFEVHLTSSDLKCDLNRPPNLIIVKYGHDVYIDIFLQTLNRSTIS